MKNSQGKGAKTCTFGRHLTLDGYGGCPKKLNDADLVRKALNELPEKLGMEKLIEPVVLYAEPRTIKDGGGYTGFVVVAESHISIHTFPKRKFVSIDAYTCKNEMSKDEVVSYFKKMFKLSEAEVNFFERGKNFPAEDLA